MNDLAKKLAGLSAEKRRLAEALLAERGVDLSRTLVEARARDPEGDPASFSQRRLWFLEQLQPGTAAYNVPQALRLRGPFDSALLEAALAGVLRRHETLRTRFGLRDGEVVQWVDPPRSRVLPAIDLRALGRERREAELRRWVRRESLRPFDLERGPIFRALLFELAEEERALLTCVHHVASDAWSQEILQRELVALYDAAERGEPSPLPDLPIQYADFARWQSRRLEGEELEKLLEFWRQRLAGASQLELPTDRPRPAAPELRGANLHFSLPRSAAAALGEIGRRRGASLFMVVSTVFKALLQRYGREDDVVLGAPVSGRTRPETENLIGFFINNLVLRTDLGGSPSFVEALERVRRSTLAAFDHQELPFEKLVAEIVGERDLERAPLFQVAFQLQTRAPRRETADGGRLRIENLEIAVTTAKVDLLLSCAEVGGRLEAVLQYATELFDASTMRRLAGHLGSLLENAAAEPERPLAELPVSSAAERQQMLREWNDTAVEPVSPPLVHRFVEQVARERPETDALFFEGETVSYGELARRAGSLARHLAALGVGPEVPVFVCLERSPALPSSLLAVLEAGGVYVPLDPDYPRERLEYVVEDCLATCGRGVLLLSAASAERFADGAFTAPGLEVLRIEEAESSPAPRVALAADAPLSGLAYVIYTSGSTGRPKGVAVTHRGLACFGIYVGRRVGVSAHGRILQFASPSFDASIAEMLFAFFHGACLVLARRGQILPGPDLHRVLAEARVTLAVLPPTALAATSEQGLPELETVITAGEACPPEAARSWSRRGRLLNGYGPTETTVGVSVGVIDGDRPRPPIGRAFPGDRVYLLDDRLRSVPLGVPGELCAASPGLARGYLGRPATSAEVFVPDPFAEEPGERLYRTGDLARHLPDGRFDFLGRIDRQIKVRGFRIEPGEIETALRSHPGVDEAVVVDHRAAGTSRLAAYFTLSEGGAASSETPSSETLRRWLRERLPEFMVPSFFVALDELPTLPNGKIDRSLLPAPDPRSEGEGASGGRGPSSPRERVLAEIWCQVLGLERLGVDDNFFTLGGDSILTIQVVSRAAQRGLEITPRQLFEHPTVAALAAVAGESRAPAAERGPSVGPVPLTPIQHWFFEHFDRHREHFNQALVLELPEDLRYPALEGALDALARHHDAFRLRYEPPGGGGLWRQVLDPPPARLELGQVDLSRLAEDDRLRAWGRLTNSLQRGLDLETGRLFRFAAVGARRPGRAERLVIVAHHLAIDGVSWRILLEDLVAAYAQLERGFEPRLAAVRTSFKDWAETLVEHAGSEIVADEGRYWLDATWPRSALPRDLSTGANTVASVDEVRLRLEEETTAELLREPPRAYGARIDEVLVAALAEAVGAWTGRRRLVVDMEGHGREDLFPGFDLSRALGWFTAMYPVAVDLDRARDSGEALRAAKEQLRAVPGRGLAHGLLRHLGQGRARRVLAEMAAAEIAFNYLGQLDRASSSEGSFQPSGEPVGETLWPGHRRRHLLEVSAQIRGGRLGLVIRFSRHRHRRSTIEALADSFRGALENLLGHCRSVDRRRYTPSDFPLAELDQKTLDRVSAEVGGEIEDVYPATPMQQGMLVQTLQRPGQGTLVQQICLRLGGGFDGRAFLRAWRRLIERQPILRTTFAWQGLEVPLQVVRADAGIEASEHDWRGLPAAEREERLRGFLQAERLRDFDFEHEPPLRLALVLMAEDDQRFVWTHHHVILDGWSNPILVRELFAFFRAELGAAPAELGPVRPFRHYVAWLTGRDPARAEAFWRRQLEGIAGPTPLGLRPPQAGHRRGESRTRFGELSAASAARLEAVVRERRWTVNTFVQGAWALLLSRRAGRSGVVFGTVSSGRSAPVEGIAEMIGLLINTLPVRAEVDPGRRLGSFLDELQERQAAMRDYEYVPLSLIQHWSEVPAGEPLFESLVVFQNFPVETAVEEGESDFALGGLEVREETDYPVSLIVGNRRGALGWRLTWEPDRLDGAEVARLGHHLEILLEAMAEAPESLLGELSVMGPSERAQVVWEWNDTAREHGPWRPVHRLFEERAAEIPEAVALDFFGRQLSYGELERRSGALAARLAGLGVGPDSRVGICLERSPEMVIAVLGTLRAGGAYLPLDPDYPDERLAFMLDDASAEVLISSAETSLAVPDRGLRRLVLDSARDLGDAPAPRVELGPENLIYTIYTSGSTGRPKGVALPHRAIANLVRWYADRGRGDGGWRRLQFASLSFDVSCFEIFATFEEGGTLVLIDRQTQRDLRRLARFLVRAGIHRWISPVGALHAVAEELSQGSAESVPLTQVVSTGEQLRVTPAVTRFFESSPGSELQNYYGPSETHVVTAATLGGEPRAWPAVPSIGRPVDNTAIHVTDDRLRPVPAGVPGQLSIGGHHLARGYLGRPALSAERFVPSPFAQSPGERLYRTGDLARHLSGGEVEFLGRADAQLKIRGFRIEPGEIEAALLRHPGVAEAVVEARRHPGGSRVLVAYWVAAEGAAPTVGELRGMLAEILPEPMVPGRFVVLDTLPLTPSRKVDRRALPEPGWSAVAEPADPRSPLEEIVAGAFAEILGLEAVDAEADFFVLGGHSLMATRVLSRLGKVTGVELSLAEFFARPTAVELAALVEPRLHSSGGLSRPPIEVVDRDRPLPLSFAQQRLWFIDRMQPESPAYNLPTPLWLEGALDPPTFEAALGEVVRRHEILRTNFVAEGGEPRLEISPPGPLPLPWIDLEALERPAAEREAARLARRFGLRPFDLGRDRLLRVALARLDSRRHLLLLTFHHIVADGWSLGLFNREISALYQAFAEGRPSPLGELEIQYADYAAWQRGWLRGEVLERELDFWRRRLGDGPPILELPADRPRPAVMTANGALASFTLEPRQSEPLRALARRGGSTLFMVLLAGFQALLSRYSGLRDIAVGTPIAGRTHLQVEDLIGVFVNTLVLRTDLGGEPTFLELLERVRSTTLEAYSHQDLPFERLVEELQPERSLSHSPLFQVMFIYQNFPRHEPRGSHLAVRPVEHVAALAKFDLTLTMAERGGALGGIFEYNSDLFDPSTMVRMGGHLKTLLAALAGQPGRAIDSLPLLTPAERHQIAGEWNDVGALGEEPLDVCRLLERRAAERPAAPAILWREEVWSYAELDRRSNQLAHRLRALGVDSERRVGLLVERSPWMMVGIFGVLKAGAAYVPLDPAYPEARLELMLDDAGIEVLVTESALGAELTTPGVRRLELDGERAEIEASSPEALPALTAGARLAYVIYTSGSTGRPKGVQIERSALANLVATLSRAPGLGADDRMLALTTLSFDMSVPELYLPFAAGATQVIASPREARDGRALAELIERFAVTVLQATPSTLRLLLESGWRPAPELRILTGGEAVPLSLAEELSARAAEVWNQYGPTETTVWSAVERLEPGAERVPIGAPVARTTFYVVDPRLEILPVGLPGELLIGGVGVSRGYWLRPGLSAEKFVPDPFSRRPGERLYRTGDVLRRLGDGRLEFLHRRDHQLKVRGFRIELGEIDALVDRHPAVRRGVAVARADRAGDPRLVAYAVLEEGADRHQSLEDLRVFLAERLPEHMVPNLLLALDELPLTLNGKVDRSALPDPEPARGDELGELVVPRSRTELMLTDVWEGLLGIRPIGVRDDFFQLGGHSLMAVRLIAQIRERFGVELPVAELFAKSTVEALAAALDQRTGERTSPTLVPMRSGGDRRPFFCVHAAGGGVVSYRHLVRALPEDQPFYGLEAPGLAAGTEPLRRVEEMAELYRREIRRLQPEGPYRIGGWSFGALVAFEIARGLVAEGAEVEHLISIDGGAPVDETRGREMDHAEIVLFLARESGLEIDAEQLRALDPEAQIAHVAARAAGAGAISEEFASRYLRRKVAVIAATREAVAAYRPGTWSGPFSLLRACDETERREALGPDYGWGRFVSGPVEIREIPGDHQSALQPPAVEAVGQQIAEIFATASPAMVENSRN